MKIRAVRVVLEALVELMLPYHPSRASEVDKAEEKRVRLAGVSYDC